MNRLTQQLKNANAMALAAAMWLVVLPEGRAITPGQADDFHSVGVAGWSEGTPSFNPPTRVATGGPGGADDAFLQNISGGDGPGSRMVMFNTAQWTGDYTAATVGRITADMKNSGSSSLHMRVAIRGGPDSSWFASTSPLFLPATDGWISHAFNLNVASLTQVSGGSSLAQVLTNVNELRILSSITPNYIGDAIVGTLDIDNITAESSIQFPTNINIAWATLDGGGGTSTNGALALRGTIGQLDAGRLTNGTTVLNGGFWGGLVVVQTPGAPSLSIAYTTSNTVAVFWPSPSVGWTLQQNTNDLSSVNWSNAPGSIDDDGTNKTLIVNPPTGNRFYRLVKP